VPSRTRTSPLGSDPQTRAAGLDLVTDLAEAAALLGHGRAADLLGRTLRAVPETTVMTGRAWVCKGPVAGYQALVMMGPDAALAS